MKKIITFLFLTVVMSSCGVVQVTTNPNTTINRNSAVTIAQEEDMSGTVGELNHLLFFKGFKVISYSTAKKAVKYKDQNKGDDWVNNETEAEIYSVTELNSIYALEMNYTYYYDVLYWAYRNFSARLVDLETGEIVMSAYFRGDRSVRSVLNELVNKMDEQVR